MSNPNNNNAEHLDEAVMPSAEQVKAYLQAHPDFFLRFPELADEIRVPHEKKGAVSLVELQAEQLRERSAERQERINRLLAVAQQNERIYRLYAELNLKLYQCESIDDMTQTLQSSIEQQFELETVRLITFKNNEADTQEWRDFKAKRFKDTHFFFGRMPQSENALLFGDVKAESVALMLLGQEGELGLLAIASNEPGHFSPEMDTLLIAQLQQLMTLLVSKAMS
ncbi:DUF484 family protein [Alteromonas sp. a30]|uniref:DUF484 family protein n=1 Tax=Alteromonas sp. a30 TaxID=2730917 RepID=UPI002280D08A|nr:DUF484 family protein [Alteromonas sp. a30]MCY7294653.1 DUF484 family protein [Alteromonas sp. a30]